MKTIIEMALESGLHRTQHNLMSNPVKHRFSYDGYEENLEAFAELVRAEAQAEEREACEALCKWRTGIQQVDAAIDTCAAAIRARGNT